MQEIFNTPGYGWILQQEMSKNQKIMYNYVTSCQKAKLENKQYLNTFVL